ncbi:MAG TPA: (2Fe-2S)-binding protein [Candidatus Saccharimonadales bacterium]|nr:(2Fe-2S)-binding protein [Candidatus Saccharimonadales bacterium]
MRISLIVNGEPRAAEAREGESLLSFLREELALPGSKNACDQGECGSCSVLLDGALVCSCLVLAAASTDKTVETVEALSAGEALHPIQQAFLDAGAVQCGFCTPGFFVATKALLARNPEPTDGEIREALAGNICRCTGYGKILEAVHAAAKGSKP